MEVLFEVEHVRIVRRLRLHQNAHHDAAGIIVVVKLPRAADHDDASRDETSEQRHGKKNKGGK